MIKRLKKFYDNLLDKFFAKAIKPRMNAALADIFSEDLAEMKESLDKIEKERLEESIKSYKNKTNSQLNMMKQELDSMKAMKIDISNEFHSYFSELYEENRKKQEENDKKLANAIDGLEKTVSSVEGQIDEKQQKNMKMIGEYIEKIRQEERRAISDYIDMFKKKAQGYEEKINRHMAEKTSEIDNARMNLTKLLASASEAIDFAKDMMANADRNVKEAIGELNNSYKVILFMDDRVKIVQKLFEDASKNMGATPEYARKVIKLACEEKYGKGILPYVELTIDSIIQKAKMHEKM